MTASTVEQPATGRRRATFHSLRVASVDRLCEDAVAVTFDVPDALRDAYAFAPGQSVTLRKHIDGREERRSYSICAPAGARLRVGVREVPGGMFSAWLVHEVRVGDEIEVQTPTGAFSPAPGTAGRHVLVAAGSGITPVLSIAATLLAKPGAHVTLLYGNRRTSSVMFAEELADLKDAHGPRFDLVHVLSREPREVELFSGRLDGKRLRTILALLVPLDAVDHVWLCGPFAMVTEARAVLADLGIDKDRVHAELFYVDDVPPEPVRHEEAGIEGPSSEVTVILDGRSTTLTLPRTMPVLDSAQASRSDLPFACKGGVCGTCRAQVTAGEVDMRRNYALEDAEVDAGFVLTCQSFPLSDSITVDYDG
ncbi:MAG: phenylacetate-CoA oxygenase/reductase subunit PaaK [Actinomycetota bacterium]|nr:phenylacetate-CoA oxygenase/reductase subunit PaaK [Actinomycetota bacterium]